MTEIRCHDDTALLFIAKYLAVVQFVRILTLESSLQSSMETNERVRSRI